jgi:thymidylate synthase (FAD)
MQKLDVLDHGFVRLVESMGSDLSVVRAARVSYDAAWRAGDNEGSDERLIRRLWRDKHTSPFEAVEFQFEVKAPIFVFRQWHRHRTWSYNELSARYRELPEEFYVPDPAIVGGQSAANKQGRDLDKEAVDRRVEASMMREHAETAFRLYRQLLEADWPRELARAVLPVSTYSHMFAKVDLRNLLHFLDLRCHSHAQYEIRVYAEAMRDLAKVVAPVCISAWEEGRA